MLPFIINGAAIKPFWDEFFWVLPRLKISCNCPAIDKDKCFVVNIITLDFEMRHGFSWNNHWSWRMQSGLFDYHLEVLKLIYISFTDFSFVSNASSNFF
ncbi:hypothetical protein GBA52_003982 [Prunus armeniaca]|nr:hypothetical protein GBA52_003982 [Prunus armeniaca]